MNKSLITMYVLAVTMAIASSVLADDPRVSDRKVKPRCSTVCRSETYCVENKVHCDLDGCCARWGTKQVCHEECS